MKCAMLAFIRFYQRQISPWFPRRCRFSPTCSQYALEAVSRYGALRGGWLAFKRDVYKRQDVLQAVIGQSLNRFTPMQMVCYVPVSYTHLDVYKRQLLRSTASPCRPCRSGSGTRSAPKPPDSHTSSCGCAQSCRPAGRSGCHTLPSTWPGSPAIDVYKRQVLQRDVQHGGGK